MYKRVLLVLKHSCMHEFTIDSIQYIDSILIVYGFKTANPVVLIFFHLGVFMLIKRSQKNVFAFQKKKTKESKIVQSGGRGILGILNLHTYT